MASSKFIRGFKANLRIMLSIGMVIIGLLHFANPDPFARIIPDSLSHPLAFVYGSGLIEILAGVGLLFPPISHFAAWILVILYTIVFPANLYQAVHNISISSLPHNPALIWLRIPMQALLIAWAFWLTKDERMMQSQNK